MEKVILGLLSASFLGEPKNQDCPASIRSELVSISKWNERKLRNIGLTLVILTFGTSAFSQTLVSPKEADVSQMSCVQVAEVLTELPGVLEQVKNISAARYQSEISLREQAIKQKQTNLESWQKFVSKPLPDLKSSQSTFLDYLDQLTDLMEKLTAKNLRCIKNNVN